MEKKIKNVEDLKSLKERAQADMDLRTGTQDIRITVHLGTCGIASGAREVLEELMKDLGDSDVRNISLQQSGCLGLCDQEPMLTVTEKSGETVRYGKLNKRKVHEIVREHILGGHPVVNYIIKT